MQKCSRLTAWAFGYSVGKVSPNTFESEYTKKFRAFFVRNFKGYFTGQRRISKSRKVSRAIFKLRKMKKIIFLIVSAFMLCTSLVIATNNQYSDTNNVNQPPVCQFSLNHYTGTLTLTKGIVYTKEVIVRLNCPQDKDVSATVFVYVNGDLIASDIFTITKGKTVSSNVGSSISCPSEYEGMKYTLKVQ